MKGPKRRGLQPSLDCTTFVKVVRTVPFVIMKNKKPVAFFIIKVTSQ